MYIDMYMVCMCVRICMCIYVSVWVSMYVHLYMCIYVFACGWIYGVSVVQPKTRLSLETAVPITTNGKRNCNVPESQNRDN